jgi:N-acylneuraminate cytidylyltransferase
LKKIAIIPARSGSKGLKDKNIIDLCGKPLMVYSVEAALKTGCFDKVIVSTDSEKYGAIAKSVGAEVMYRGEELSNDKATTYDVLKDLLGRVDGDIDYFVLLQPTSPMRSKKHILEAIEKFESNMDRFDFLVSMSEADHAKVLVNPIDDDESLKYFDTDFANYRRQSFKDYCPNGAIFIGKPEAYIQRGHFFGDKSIAFIMDKYDSVDIDDEIDYELAQICMRKRLGI